MKFRNSQWRCLKWSILISLVGSGILGFALIIYGGLLIRWLNYFVQRWFDFDAKKISLENLNFDIHESKKPFYRSTDRNPVKIHAELLCSAGAIKIIYSIAGVCSILTFSTFLLKSTIVLITISVMFNLFVFAQFIDDNSLINKWSKDSMTTSMFLDFDSNSEHMSFWNSIMIMGECCGISGPGDFQFRTGMNETKDDISMPRMWPPACCTNTLLRMSNISKDCYEVAMPNDVMSKINIEGCYFKLMKVFGLNFSYYTVIIISCSVYQMVQVILCLSLVYILTFIAMALKVINKEDKAKLPTPAESNSVILKASSHPAKELPPGTASEGTASVSSYGVVTAGTGSLMFRPTRTTYRTSKRATSLTSKRTPSGLTKATTSGVTTRSSPEQSTVTSP